MKKFNFMLFLMLVLNYYLIVWILVQYNIDGYYILFVVLLCFLSVERIFSIIRGTFAHTQESQQLDIGLMKSIALNLIFFDYSIQIDSNQEQSDDQLKNDQNYLFNLNFLAHCLNHIPIIFNIYILLNESTQTLQSYNIYLAITIYGISHQIIIDFINYKLTQRHHRFVLLSIYRFIQNGCKKVCFFMLIAVLINYRLSYLLLYIIYLLRYVYSLFQAESVKSLELLPILQIQYVFSSQLLSKYDIKAIHFLRSNLFQYLMLMLLLIIHLSINQALDIYSNRIIYATFIANTFEILSSVVSYYLFLKKGPLKFKIGITVEMKNYKKKISNLIRLLHQKKFSLFFSMFINLQNYKIFQTEELIDIIKYVMHGSIFYHLKVRNLDSNNQITNLITLTSQKDQLSIEIENIKEFNQLQILISYFLQNIFSSKQINIKINQILEIQLQKLFVQELCSYYPNKIIINDVNQNDLFSFWYSQQLSMTLFYNKFSNFIPINPTYLLYDLHE
ncbi:transmembrane protein, putative (macronuclear) [Tetrahymena thermophila SB210]|uniref:Transmembrane protein, putative n=1 Tax=Tetrahymena thermophila (strain SB210) TaxID=312017 RepID=W7XL73_TETTS|nr:transmembrane protein, putative [Tetrahymena thermophila SB210]EWS75789.1 transmembrane protein, putative [Tetrahymena thermophila SB210]|eukprot:XP_012651711.1 transmembrane protein, putative [Tetrahymena thermophila SB210]